MVFFPDTSLRDGLFHEYKRFGKVMSVTLKGEKEGRIAVVTFKKADDAAKAYEQSIDRVFFGKKIQVMHIPTGTAIIVLNSSQIRDA